MNRADVELSESPAVTTNDTSTGSGVNGTEKDLLKKSSALNAGEKRVFNLVESREAIFTMVRMRKQ